MKALLHPTYFPSIAQCVAIAKAEDLVFEKHDNFQKQTYRNRTYIYGANGKLQLSIPIIHSHKNRQLYKDVKISNTEKWQQIHWKSLEAAYRTSPFFEYYEDEFISLFEKRHEFIYDFNLKCFEVVSDCLQLDLDINFTESYQTEQEELTDFRPLVNARKEPNFNFEHYRQVFFDKCGYIDNLSVLDLLFNEGTNALTYLENQELPTHV